MAVDSGFVRLQQDPIVMRVYFVVPVCLAAAELSVDDGYALMCDYFFQRQRGRREEKKMKNLCFVLVYIWFEVRMSKTN